MAVQVCGGNGIGKDLPLADFYANVRTFRIVDGADEVHLRTIARDTFEDIDERELESVTRFGQPNAYGGPLSFVGPIRWPAPTARGRAVESARPAAVAL